MSNKKRAWEENNLEPMKQRFKERRSRFETTSGIEIDTAYTPEDLPDFNYDEQLGYPGEYPYTRGVQPNMYRGRLWTMRQYAGFASPEESNRRYRYLLEEGQTGLSVAFDLPTQMGYDSDYPQANGEIGRTGVPISSLADMEAARLSLIAQTTRAFFAALESTGQVRLSESTVENLRLTSEQIRERST